MGGLNARPRQQEPQHPTGVGPRQQEPQHPTGEDYVTFMKDLEEIETYLKTVNSRLSRDADDGDSGRPLEDLQSEFFQALELKQQQLRNIRMFIQSVARTPQPAPQSLGGLVDAVEKLCQETISRFRVGLAQNKFKRRQ
jgi:hypothetical protein